MMTERTADANDEPEVEGHICKWGATGPDPSSDEPEVESHIVNARRPIIRD